MPITPRATFGTGYSTSAPSEQQYVAGVPRAWSGGKPPLILCHGATDTAASIAAVDGFRALVTALAQDHLVVAADLGGDQWGNDTHLARIGQAIAYANSLGATGKPRLAGISMGTLGALGYARANPGAIAAVGVVIPALDLGDLYANRGFSANINAAYPPSGYNDATMGTTRSPVKYAAGLPADLPIGLWTSSDDPYTVPSTADAFVTARPATWRTNLGALGHTPAAVAAAAPLMAAWMPTIY